MSRLSEVEVASGLARRARDGDCGVQQRDVALAALDGDIESFLVLEIVPAVTSRARALLNAYALPAADAIQLASCHYLQQRLGHDVPFVVYDQRLAAVARESGRHRARRRRHRTARPGRIHPRVHPVERRCARSVRVGAAAARRAVVQTRRPTPWELFGGPRHRGLAATRLVEEGLDAARDFLAGEALVRGPAAAQTRRWHGQHAKHSDPPSRCCYSPLVGGRTAPHGGGHRRHSDLYGHTNPSTTMIHAPPEPVRHQAATARLRLLEIGAGPKRLAVPDGFP